MGHELDAIERTYDVIQWTLGRLESFPKVYRIPLGDRMQQTLYGILDVLIEAKYTRGRQKLGPLARANVLLERLRFQGRLACERRCISLGVRVLCEPGKTPTVDTPPWTVRLRLRRECGSGA